MGCDIHFHIEVKVNGSWEHYGSPDINREYNVFAILGNVRGGEHGTFIPVSDHRGIPEDATIITKMCYEDIADDAHGMSYIDRNEFHILQERLNKLNGSDPSHDLEYHLLHTYLMGNSFEYAEYKSNLYELEDVRFIFWFDN